MPKEYLPYILALVGVSTFVLSLIIFYRTLKKDHKKDQKDYDDLEKRIVAVEKEVSVKFDSIKTQFDSIAAQIVNTNQQINALKTSVDVVIASLLDKGKK